MSNRKQAYYVVATAAEVLFGVDEDDLGEYYVAEYKNILNSLVRFRDRLSGSLEREDVVVQARLK